MTSVGFDDIIVGLPVVGIRIFKNGEVVWIGIIKGTIMGVLSMVVNDMTAPRVVLEGKLPVISLSSRRHQCNVLVPRWLDLELNSIAF